MQSILIFVIVLAAVLLSANTFYVFVVVANTQEHHIRAIGHRKYSYLAFGSTYCRYALDFRSVGADGYNLGYAAQFFYYTDLMVRRFVHNAKPGAVIFIICAALAYAKVGKGELGCYDYKKYIHFMDRKSLGDEFSVRRYITDVVFPLVFHPSYWKPTLITAAKSILPRYILQRLKHARKSELLTKEQMWRLAEERCDSWCRQFGLKDVRSTDIPVHVCEAFIKSSAIVASTVQFCLDKGLRPVLVATPWSPAMIELVGGEFMQKVYYDNIERSNPHHVPFLDYTRDLRFQDYSLFKTADLLNERGCQLFTEILISDTKKAYRL